MAFRPANVSRVHPRVSIGEAQADAEAQADEHVHRVRFFETEAFPAVRIAAFLRGAISERRAAMAFATRAHIDELTSALEALGVDVRASIARNLLVMCDAMEMARAIGEEKEDRGALFQVMVGEPVRAAIARTGGVRVYGEIVDVFAHAQEHAAALELEALWDDLLAEGGVELLCGYTLGTFAEANLAEAFDAVCRAHSRVEDGELPEGRLAVELQHARSLLELEAERRAQRELEHQQLRSEERAARILAQGASEHLERLQRLTSALCEAATHAEIADAVISELKTVFGVDRLVLAVAIDEGTKLLAFESRSDGRAHDQVLMPIDADVPVARAFAGRIEEHALGPSELCIPLASGGRALGALGVTLLEGHDLLALERALLSDYVKQIALAIDRASSFEEAKRANAQLRVLAEQAKRERERAESERARADAANRAKDEFLAMLGHELRNPLSPILTALQLMKLRSDVFAKERAIIERQANHMVRLIDDLLDVSRIARGKLELKRSSFALADMVANAIEMASPFLEVGSHELEVDVPEGVVIAGDAERLAQVVANLLSNAAKYTPPHGHIHVTANATPESVAIAVKDDGIGIDPALAPQLFDRFVQGPRESDRAQGGLGLGLAIVQNIMRMHGGGARAASDGLGQGSVFTIELPRAPVDAASQASDSERSDPRASGRRILVVDDNVDAACMLAEMLSSVGHLVRVAHDGPEALREAEGFAPELALLDIGLPVMDGYELGQRLLRRDPQPKVIAISGYGQDADRRRSHECGFAEHLVKPVHFAALEGAIAKLFAEADA
jgi:signal transduction histidine kinase/ActR/RegA family two-component response regulator